MKKLYDTYLKQVNTADLLRRTKELCRIEMLQTTPAQHRASEYILSELEKAGIPNAEIVKLPADGKSVFMDKISPLAWDISVGKLTLCDNENTVAADYTQNPFNVIKGSCATLPGGEKLPIITEQQFLAGEDPSGALVMLEPLTWPRKNVLKPILDRGGRGIISDFLQGRYDTPDCCQWVNAGTESGSWHVNCRDREFIGFSVTPRMGDIIRQKANAGQFAAIVESDGRRYADTQDVITALIPGRKKQEIWLLAHTSEPLLDDDSSGINACIEIAEMIMREGVPEYSLRLVFAMEVYGFAAYRAMFDHDVIGGCNLDTIPSTHGSAGYFHPPIAAVPFHGVEILKNVVDELKDITAFSLETGSAECFDDMFMSEPTAGIPTAWLLGRREKGYWHNSRQTEMDFIDPEIFTSSVAVAAVWTCQVLNYTGALPSAPEFDFEPVSSPWRDYAAQQIYARKERGLPHDLAKIPLSERIALPDGVLYGPMASIIAYTDGKRTLAEVIRIVENERGTTISEAMIKKYVDAVNYLTDWGYLSAVKRTAITRAMITDKLADIGVAKGDVLLVHGALSGCGYIDGGAETVINALLDAVGSEGTVLFPTFTAPYLQLGGHINRSYRFRPYDPADPEQVCVGNLPRMVLKKFPQAIRSAHVSHSWAGIGPQAEYCVSAHGAFDPPASANSPMGKALELGGKVLFFGSGLAPTTFLHFVETAVDASFLQPALCAYKKPDGSIGKALLEQHLPGHRDFYNRPGADAENCKFYRQAVSAGLKISKQTLGMGKLHMIGLTELYDIAMQLCKADPDILLCDDPGCLFCSRSKHK